MTIVISNHQRSRKINAGKLKKIVEMLMRELMMQNVEIEINLVNAAEMERLNRQFLKHEGSTDVITFDYCDTKKRGFQQAKKKGLQAAGSLDVSYKTVQGEIFVCVDDAILQAGKFKTSWESEILRYIIHGVLHLLGHDDLLAAARRKMRREENYLMHGLSKTFSLAEISRISKMGV